MKTISFTIIALLIIGLATIIKNKEDKISDLNPNSNYGVYYYDNEEEEIIDVKWFKTIKKRKQYLRGVK